MPRNKPSKRIPSSPAVTGAKPPAKVAIHQEKMSAGPRRRRAKPVQDIPYFKFGGLIGILMVMMYFLSGRHKPASRDEFLASTVLYLNHTRSPYTPTSPSNTPQILEDLLSGKYREVEKIAKKVCDDIRSSKLKEFNNQPHRFFSEDTAIRQRTELKKYYIELRDIINNLIKNRIDELNEEFKETDASIEDFIRQKLAETEANKELLPIDKSTYLDAVREYKDHLAVLVGLHINEAVLQYSGGGFCREFAYLAALKIILALQENDLPIPSLSIISMLNPNEQSIHSLLGINRGRPTKIPEQGTSFCDSSLPFSQGPAFFTDLETHPAAPDTTTVAELWEAGIPSTLIDFNQDIQKAFEDTRQEILTTCYALPAAELQRLIELNELIHNILEPSTLKPQPTCRARSGF